MHAEAVELVVAHVKAGLAERFLNLGRGHFLTKFPPLRRILGWVAVLLKAVPAGQSVNQ